MITFDQINQEVSNAVGRTSASEIALIRRSTNTAVQRFKSSMSRPWSRVSKKTDIVSEQQDYQLPRSVLRPSGVEYKYGDNYFPLQEVGGEDVWGRMNAAPSVTIGIPRFYFPKGKNVISLYPIPGDDLTEGLRVYYEPKQSRMVASDFSTGLVTVTNGVATIQHSAAGFTEDMIGRTFFIDDESDGNSYLIVDFNNTSELVLENYYEGISGAGRPFIIGAVPDIPEEYHDAVIDYSIARVYMRRRDTKAAGDFLGNFNTALEECKELYASPTSNMVIPNYGDMAFDLFSAPPQTIT